MIWNLETNKTKKNPLLRYFSCDLITELTFVIATAVCILYSVLRLCRHRFHEPSELGRLSQEEFIEAIVMDGFQIIKLNKSIGISYYL